MKRLSMRPALFPIPTATPHKNLGQCFTGELTGRLLAALAVLPQHRRIVDPMAGQSDLLVAAGQRAFQLGARVELFGAEIEPETARIGKQRLETIRQKYRVVKAKLELADAFQRTTWESFRGGSAFDLVITNPPYVRYQSLASDRADDTQPCLDGDTIRRALNDTAQALAPVQEVDVWKELIWAYSGLADLSLPSWLLCGLLTKPGGMLALVAPQTWLNRDYARLARYAFLRFFEPVFVVEESGQRWFQNVLVSVSLVVGRRLPPEIASQPLFERMDGPKETLFVEIRPEAGSSTSHVGCAFNVHRPEEEFVHWLKSEHRQRKQGIKVTAVSWKAQRHELLARCSRFQWFQDLEKRHAESSHYSACPVGVPAAIASLIPRSLWKTARPLSATPVRVGQGLRTGCNKFFYVEVADSKPKTGGIPVVTSELFGRCQISVPVETLSPVLRRQVEIAGHAVRPELLRGRVLDLRGWLLPEDARRILPRSNLSSAVASCRVMPRPLAEYVRMAANTYIKRGEKRIRIPSLSAVRTNEGAGSSDWDVFPEMAPQVVRMWYMLPDFAARHLPAVFIPRIVHECPRPLLNCSPPILIDANFSTLWATEPTWCPHTIFALLSSTWAQLCMEAIGSPMGGGALKLEATHLRELPIPTLSTRQLAQLNRLGAELLKSPHGSQAAEDVIGRIDAVVILALQNVSKTRTAVLTLKAKLSQLTRQLQLKRRRCTPTQTCIAL